MNANTGRADRNTGDILREVLTLAHPILAEAIYLAAIPHWYDLPLFSAVRNIDDNRNEGLIPRLQKYSFVIPLTPEPQASFRVRNRERLTLHRLWIDRDAAGYIAAHQRMFEYLASRPNGDSPAADFERLYHHFFVDLPAGASEVIRLFQRYAAERRLGAIEYLLDGVDEAYELLRYLSGDNGTSGDGTSDGGQPPPSTPPQPSANLVYFAQLRRFLRAGLLEMRGRRLESKEMLLQLRRTSALAAELKPYVSRTFANLLRSEGKYVEAIDELENAIKGFQASIHETEVVLHRSDELEQAASMLILGDTYVEFARSVRGESRRDSVQLGFGRQLQSVAEFIASIPLLLYLSIYLGARVWHPDFWITLFGLDWIVGRLFALGAQQYELAAPILRQMGAPEERELADEKLANLFLEMGDVIEANRLFTRLLNNDAAPLGPYRRLISQLGLAETEIQMGESTTAQTTLQRLIPSLEEYADAPNLAHAYALLAEATLRNRNFEDAQDALAAAVSRYRALESLTDLDKIAEATNIQERIEALAHQLEAPPPVQQAIAKNGESLDERRYTAGYQHPAYVRFRRIVLFLMPVALVLVFVSTIQLESEISLDPIFAFRPAPILDPNITTPTQLSQSVTDAQIRVNFDPESIFPIAAAALILYLVIFTALGVWIIQDAPLAIVQARNRAASISVRPDGISVGDAPDGQSIRWHEVTRVIEANTSLWRRPIASASATTVVADAPSAPRKVVISGSTNWYIRMAPRLRHAAPPTAQIIDLNQSVFHSAGGAIYITSAFIFLLIALVATVEAWGSRLWVTLPLTPYSIADLYPYLYFGLILIPVWWAIVRPIQISRHMGATTRSALYWLASAGVLALFMIARSFRPLLTVPDLYPPLFVIATVAASLWLLWHVAVAGTRLNRLWLWGLTGVGMLTCVAMLSYLSRDIYAYHLLVLGNRERDQARHLQEREASDTADERFRQALNFYEHALAVSETPIWLVGPTVDVSAGLPPYSRSIRMLSLKNAAALQAQVGDGSQAEMYYTELLQYADEPDQLHAWRAMARLRAAAQTGDQALHDAWYDSALEDYNQAISIAEQAYGDNLAPAQRAGWQLHMAQYRLWRGLAYHAQTENRAAPEAAQADYEAVLAFTDPTQMAIADPISQATAALLRERALTGMGWLIYSQASRVAAAEKQAAYQAAAAWFEQAINANPAESEAWLGLGYARYAAGVAAQPRAAGIPLFHKAGEAWQKALELDPADPSVHISLGTLHWKLAQFETDPVRLCELYTQAISLHADAVDTTRMRPQEDAAIAYSYRTMGRIYYLIGNCRTNAGDSYEDKESVYRRAIESFDRAIALDASVGEYPQVRGRYAYALWDTQPESAKDYNLLYAALDDLNRAAALGSPATDYVNYTLDALLPHAINQLETALQAGQIEAMRRPLTLLLSYQPAAAEEIRNALRQLYVDPSPVLATHAEIDGNEFRAQIQSLLQEMADIAPASWLFDLGINALVEAQPGIAVAYFEDALRDVKTQADLTSAQDRLVSVSALRIDPQARTAVLREYRRALPQLEATVQATPTVHALVTVGTIAAILEDMQRAGRLYAQAIQLNNAADNSQYNLLRRVWEPLLLHWRGTGSTATDLLAAFDQQLAIQLEADPELETEEYYWGVRAWFKYWLGRSAFRAWDEEGARAILDSAQLDADRAYTGGTWEGNADIVHSYIREGAWAWYHLERGDDQRSRSDYHRALIDYQSALRENKAAEDMTALAEKATAQERIANAYLNLGDLETSVATYHQMLLFTSLHTLQREAIRAGTGVRNTLLVRADIGIADFYTAFVEATPEDAILAAHPAEGDYWRHRAEFGLNVAFGIFLARPAEDQPVLAVVEHAIQDVQRAAELDDEHADRAEFFRNGLLAWVYRERGNQHLLKNQFELAYADYQSATENARPLDAESTQIMLDAMLRAGVSALHLGNAAQATSWFAGASTLYNSQDDPSALVSIVEEVRPLLNALTSEKPEVMQVRLQTLSTLNELLAP